MALDSYIVWLIPRGQVLVREGGPVWDFNAEATDPGAVRFRWDDVVKSISEWVAMARPPVLMEHQRPGPGEAVEIWGHVVEAFALTAAEAEAAGIEAHNLADSLYARIAPGPELAELRAAGKVGPCSPGLEAGFTDDDGRRWPLVLWELSHTSAPRQRSRQPTPQSLLAAALSDPRRGGTMARKVRLNEEAAAAAVDVVEDAVDAAVEEVAAETPDLAAALAGIQETLAMLVGMMTPPAEAPLMDGDVVAQEEADAAITMSDIDRIVTQRVALAERRRAHTAEIKRTKAVDDAVAADLADLRSSDPARYTRLMATIPARKPGPVIGLADARQGGGTLSERAADLAGREGIKFSEAVDRLAKKGA